MAAAGSDAPYTELPATARFTPASLTWRTFASVMPPSTSIIARSPRFSISARNAATLVSDSAMNFCPPKPK